MGLKLSKQGPETNNAAKIMIGRARYSLIGYITNTSIIRNMVSKHRRRMLVSGYDLDMSYITDRILAMSFPAERMRAVYRNPLWQVKSVLDTRHPEHYKIYNLCIEESYDTSHFHGRVETYPFDDNHVPPLNMVKIFCESVYLWLSQDSKNIAVVHCMAGKGRTGLMVCAYLVYCGMTPEDALQLYANKRTTNNQGVSIPSQRRYVGYWGDMLAFPTPKPASFVPPKVNLPETCERELRRIRLYDTVNTNAVFFVVSELQNVPGQLYSPPVEVAKNYCRPVRKGSESGTYHRYFLSFNENYEEEVEEERESDMDKTCLVVQMDTESPMIYKKTCLDYCFDKPILVKKDVRVIFYEKKIGGRFFYVCFNTAFITNSLLQFSIRDLDKIGNKGRSICGSDFCLELLFGPANSKGSWCASDEEDDEIVDLHGDSNQIPKEIIQ